MRKKDEEGSEYLLSVYDVKQAKVLSQVEVGRKENEIAKAPQALKSVEISRKVVTADALHTQKRLSAQIVEQGGDYVFPVKENQPMLYNNIQQLFAPEYPKPGFGKIQTDFLTVQKVSKGHGRIENSHPYDQRNAQPLFDLARPGTSVSFATTLRMVACWTLLSYFP